MELDIIIPVYNEGENIAETLFSFKKFIKSQFRVLICYDFDEDNTIPVVKRISGELEFPILFIKNKGEGVHSAIISGFEASSAEAVLMFPADEAHNARIIDRMYQEFKKGNDVVVASRFMRGGYMRGGPFLKSIVVRVASFLLHRVVGVPASDASYGLRLFSKKILDTILLESTLGFTYAIELLVKCHRMKWGISEVPAVWEIREKGQSRFNFRKWLPHYSRWFFYAIGTTYFRLGPETIKLKSIKNL